MGRVHVQAHGSFPPERFVAALTDFGPGRAQIWGNSDPAKLTVHGRGDTWAEVTEGSPAAGSIWQRSRYDWSAPGVVTLDVLDSNAFGPGSRWTYLLEPDGGRRRRHRPHDRAGADDAEGPDASTPCSALGGSAYFARDLRRTIGRLESATPRRDRPAGPVPDFELPGGLRGRPQRPELGQQHLLRRRRERGRRLRHVRLPERRDRRGEGGARAHLRRRPRGRRRSTPTCSTGCR